MPDLSVLIAARREKYLNNTVDDVLAHARADTEIIVVLDGDWADPPLTQHPRVQVVRVHEPIGQRAAINLAASISTARYVMKLDGHCLVDDGFDVELIRAAKELGPDVLQIPRQYHAHVYNWRCDQCGEETVQGLRPALCPKCTHSALSEVLVWERRGKRRGRKTTEPIPKDFIYSDAWRFDAALHFQYFPELEQRQRDGDLVETLSFLGACFFCEREYFWRLGGCDVDGGIWGQFATEWSCKAWLSGGRVVTNRRTWYAHFFRVGGIGFPYPLSGEQVNHAREYSRSIWLHNAWPQQIHPLSWLLEKFAPVPGWGEKDLDAARDAGEAFDRAQMNRVMASLGESFARKYPGTPEPTKGCIWYSDCRPVPEILRASQRSVEASGLPIVAVTLKPIDWPGAHSIVLPLERGYLSMFRQILAGLEALDTDVVFFCEHDVLYAPEHFSFTPPRDDVYYYNLNVFKVDAQTGRAVTYETKQTSGLCGNRHLLIDHYRKRIARVEAEGFSRKIGFEPGSHSRQERIDNVPSDVWRSTVPNLDIRHKENLTATRWSPSEFRSERSCRGWREVSEIPGWGVTRGRMPALLAMIAGEPPPQSAPQSTGPLAELAVGLVVAHAADRPTCRVQLQGHEMSRAAVGGHPDV